MTVNYSDKYNFYLDIINKYISGFFDKAFGPDSSYGKLKMKEAMLYSVESGGKRIRPVLTLAFCEHFGGDISIALPFAAAVEFIHTYSLIHDDLPCMDDDELRRGKPSNHIKFGEANALLAGDSLLNLAFECASNADCDSKVTVSCIKYLSSCSGSSGMIAGQVMDLHNENSDVSYDDIVETDKLKTGALIKSACVIGAVCAGADANQINIAEKYAENIGLAFQIVDDILDKTASQSELGKPVGSDEANNKNTYVSYLGINESEAKAKELTDSAVKLIAGSGNNIGFLTEFALNMLNRRK